MGTLNEDLNSIKTVEDTITANKVANFAYTDYAYSHNDANGVNTYDVNQEQNIPVPNAQVLNVNETVLSKGWRSQASSITRMLLNHFLGRLSYNLNKVNDNMSSLLTTFISHLGQANGIATLDANGRIPYAQLPESAIEYKGNWDASTNTPHLANGTGTKGDFYICTVAGTVDFGAGNISFLANDRAIYDGAIWSKLSAGDVRSVNSKYPDPATGNVAIAKSDVGLGSVANTGDSANASSGGTTKFTTGGAYNLLTSLAPIFSTSTAYAIGDFVTYHNKLYECTTAHSAGAWSASHFTARNEDYILKNYILPSLAPVFSTSTAYTVGQFVFYQNKLYRCSTAHSAGAWNSSHFTLANLNDVVNAGNATGTLPITHGGTGRSTTANGAYFTTGTGKSQVEIGTLPVAQGGTGKTLPDEALNSFINALSTGNLTPKDDDYFISQSVDGGSTTTTYHRRTISKLWDYIKGKLTGAISEVLTSNLTASKMVVTDANGKLTVASTIGVTGVKGNSETTYRTGDVNITKSNIGLGNVANTGDSATPVEGGTTKFTTGGAYTELAKKVSNADSCAYRYYGSMNGTTRYITITFNDTYGGVIITTGYGSNLFFLANKGTPFSDAGSTSYGVSGYAWSSDGKTLYLKVGGYRPIAVTVPSLKRTEIGTIGDSGIKVNFADAVTTAPSGVTFVTTTGQIDTVGSRDTAISAAVATKVDKTTTVNGHALSGNVSVSKSDVSLGNVANTGDSANASSGGTTKFTTGGAYNLLTSLAPIFSTSTAYAVGTLVTYQNKLYECTTAHSAGAWNASHFTAVTVTSKFVRQTTTVNGHALSSNVSVTKSDVGLGNVANKDLSNVVNTGDSNTPVAGGTTKFTTGGAYSFFNGSNSVGAWLGKVFGWALGRHWSAIDPEIASYTFNKIHYGNGVWVAGSTSHGLWWSTNGRSWTQGTGSMTSYTFNSVYYGNGVWVAGSNSHGFWRSTDGKAWTQVTGTTASYSVASVYNAFNIQSQSYIWVASIGLQGLWWSNDGTTWTKGTGSMNGNYHNVVHCVVNTSSVSVQSLWVVGGTAGIVWSTDGKAWTQGTGAVNFEISSVYYGNGVWVAGSTSHGLWWSADGKAWTQVTGATTGYTFNSVYYANCTWIAVSASHGIWWSNDGINWVQALNLTTSTFNSVYNADSTWVAGGSSVGIWYADWMSLDLQSSQ